MAWRVTFAKCMLGLGLLLAGPGTASADNQCSPYGINAHIPDGDTLQSLAEAGLGWVRMDFNWHLLEPAKGQFNWAPFDTAVQEAQARGLKVFATLAYSPKWAVANPTCMDGTANPCRSKPPASTDDWSEFVIATVQHFKGKVSHWGMWNEPNLEEFFEGSLEDYVDRILVPGAQAVKWADPSATVLGPELAGLTKSSQWNGDQGTCVLGSCIFNGWELDLAQVLDLAGSSIDVITHHFYKNHPEDLAATILDGEFDDLTGLIKTHSSLKEIVEAHAPGKEVWLTEYGWETKEYGGFSGGGEVSESDQATSHADFLGLRRKIEDGTWSGSDNDPWPNLAKVFIYDARDSVVNGQLWAYGILRVDGSPKPAWEAIKAYIAGDQPDCPSVGPKFKTLPLISVTQGLEAPKALDLWEYTEDPDTAKEDLVYTLLDGGEEQVHVQIEDGHFVSAYPETSWVGFTQAKVEVSDESSKDTADFGVSVAAKVTKAYEATWMEPVMDGNLVEWGNVVTVQLKQPHDWVTLTAEPAGPSDLSAVFRMTWAGDHLYIGVEVTDNTHLWMDPTDLLWQGDSLQVALDLDMDQTEDQYDEDGDWEFGVAETDGATAVHCSHTPTGVDLCPVTAITKRSGNRTYYEVDFFVEDPPKEFGMSFLVNENDGSGREGFLQWTPGMGLTKDPFQFGTVSLTGGPPPDPEPIPDMAVPDMVTDPGTTADNGVMDPGPMVDTGNDSAAFDVAGEVSGQDLFSAEYVVEVVGVDPGGKSGGSCHSGTGHPSRPWAPVLWLFLALIPLFRILRPACLSALIPMVLLAACSGVGGSLGDLGQKPDTVQDTVSPDPGAPLDPGTPQDPGAIPETGGDLSLADSDQDPATDPCGQDACCVPDCTGKECGDDGCGGICGTCEVNCTCESGQCLGCGGEPEEMAPFCLHVPPVVAAGESFPIAVFGEMGCNVFDHVEVNVVQEAPGAYQVTVKVMGMPDPEGPCVGYEVCEPWMWTYLGLAWAQAPGPGTIVVKAGDLTTTVLASSGAMAGPECQEGCASPPLESVDWSLVHASEGPMAWGCNEQMDFNQPFEFEGQCQNYVIGGLKILTIQSMETHVKHCTDSLVLFQSDLFPNMDMSATLCQRPNPGDQPLWAMLGTITGFETGGTASGVFLMEGKELPVR